MRQRIGVALQEAALDMLMTGRELMELQATLHGIPPREVADRAADLIERVGLSQAADRRVGTYSGGMRRRLDLAMALIHAPEVLFLDEPTTGPGPDSPHDAVGGGAPAASDEGTTVFLTTQYLEEADQLADRVGIISARQDRRRGHAGRAQGRGRRARTSTSRLHGEDARPRPRARGRSARFGDRRARPREGCHLSVARRRRRGGDRAGRARARRGRAAWSRRSSSCEPTLDDVFVDKTGRHLEGADEAAPPSREPVEPEPVA